MEPLSAAEVSLRSMRGRLAALSRHARSDGREAAAAARAAGTTSWVYFERRVDPDGVLDPEERRRRAAIERKAYFTRLALKSVESRRRGKNRQKPFGAA